MPHIASRAELQLFELFARGCFWVPQQCVVPDLPSTRVTISFIHWLASTVHYLNSSFFVRMLLVLIFYVFRGGSLLAKNLALVLFV